MPRLADHLRLPATRRFQATIATLIDRATPALHRAFDDLDNLDEESIGALTTAAAPTMAAVQAGAVRSSLGYYTVLAGVRPPAIDVSEVTVEPDLRAPFISVWQALAVGVVYVAAVAAGRSRVEAVVSNYAVSSARQTGRLFIAKADLKVSLWERLPDAGACTWCQLVAENVYHDADTADFGHDRCRCTVAPLFN